MSKSLRLLATIANLVITLPYPLQQFQTTHKQCNAIIHSDFENCTWQSRKAHAQASHTCKNKSVCGREFTISYIRLRPYYDRNTLVEQMMAFCCGQCAKLKTVNNFSDVSKVSIESLVTSDFVYPFLAETGTDMIHGFHFIPMIDVPGMYYITRKTISPKETLLALVKACADLWPVFTICILMAMVSGFVVWSAETWHNEREFSRTFYHGMLDGFWWAFVSMTTVGYGDKVPQSWYGRLVAIVWILLGISICSIFTAALTNAIIETVKSEVPEMGGRRVGCLKHRLYEATIIAQYGGKITDIEDEDFVSGIRRLLVLLAEDEIEGIAIDKLIYNLFKLRLSDKSERLYNKTLEEQFYNNTVVTEIFSKKSDALSFGLLVRNRQDNVYFRKYITDNRMQVTACDTLRLNSFQNAQHRPTEVNIFSLEAGLFWTSFAVTVGVLLGIFAFGFLYENTRMLVNCYQRMKRKQQVQQEGWKVKYQHTEYKQYWLDVCAEKETVVGKTTTRRKTIEPLTRTQLSRELIKQNVNVIYLENCDVLIFSEA